MNERRDSNDTGSGFLRRMLSVSGVAVFSATAAMVAWGASGRLTVKEYRAQASAICNTANRQLSHHHPANFAGEIEFDFATNRAANTALARLKPPLRLAPLHAKMLVDTRALLSEFPPLVTAAKKGMAAYERESAHEATRRAKLGNAVAALWKKMGVSACNK